MHLLLALINSVRLLTFFRFFSFSSIFEESVQVKISVLFAELFLKSLVNFRCFHSGFFLLREWLLLRLLLLLALCNLLVTLIATSFLILALASTTATSSAALSTALTAAMTTIVVLLLILTMLIGRLLDVFVLMTLVSATTIALTFSFVTRVE